MKIRFQILAMLAAAAIAHPTQSQAGTHYWSGAAGILFSDAANWSAGGPPTPNEQNVTLIFPGNAVKYTCSNNIPGLTVSQMNISGSKYYLYGNAVTVTSGITNSGTLNGLDFPVVLGSSNVVVDVAAGTTFYVYGAISGSGGLVKTGLGTLQYMWDTYNTYTGTTFVNNGTLTLAKSMSSAGIVGPLVVGTPTGSPGTAIVQVPFASQITSSSIVTVNFTGVLQLATDPDWIGGLVMAGGTVDTGTGMLALMGDVSILSGASTIQGKLELYHTNRVFNAAPGGALTINASIVDAVGSAGIIKTGPGSVTLAGSNTFTGPVVVTSGYVTLKNDLSLAHTSGITVSNLGILQLIDVRITNVIATLSGNGNGNGAMRAFGTNVWEGQIILGGASGVQCLATNDLLTVSGAFGGSGNLTKLGTGRLIMAGPYANNHSGTTTVREGILQLSKSAALAIVGPLVIGDATNAANSRAVSLTAANQIGDLVDVTVNASGRLDLNSTLGLTDTIGSLAGAGTVNLGFGGSLAAGTNNATTTFVGSITGWGGTFTKQGLGTLTLSGNNVNFLGYIAVASGELTVNGDSSSCQVMVNPLATLDGSGFIGVMTNSGFLSPGNSPGVLTTKDASFTPGSIYNVQLNGTQAGAGYDQLNAFGAVTLNNVILNAHLGFGGALSNQFVIIQNDNSDPVAGTFNGLPEGSVFTIDGTPFQITYQGGQGSNDVVLTQIGLAQPPQIGGITSLPGGQMKLSGTGTPGANYTVLGNNDLATTNWFSLGVIVAGQNGALSFTDADAPNHPMRFYRFRAN